MAQNCLWIVGSSFWKKLSVDICGETQLAIPRITVPFPSGNQQHYIFSELFLWLGVTRAFGQRWFAASVPYMVHNFPSLDCTQIQVVQQTILPQLHTVFKIQEFYELRNLGKS